MRQLMECRAIRSVCYALVAALVSMVAPVVPARAQLMPNYSVAIVDFVNESGVLGNTLARIATDAVQVEMSKTSRYDVSVITRTQIKDEMDRLDMHPPLDKVNLVRLGEALTADAILEGAIKSVQLAGSGPTARASATLAVQLIDQASGEVINGAVQTGTSSARVGYTADPDALITEAVSKAAFLVVKTMVDYVIPEATVQVNIGADQIQLNRGSRDGIKPGMRMIVLRSKEIIGYVEIREVENNSSIAKIVKSMRGVQPEDKLRAIFDMPAVGSATMKTEPMPGGAPARGHVGSGAAGKIGKFFLGALIVFGLVNLVRGQRGSEPPPAIGTLGPTEITWNPTKYGHGLNVLEYQVLRDSFANGSTPVKALRDPTDIDAGRTSLARLYGTGPALAFNYYALTANPGTSYTSTAVTLPIEPYGVTHQYQVRVLYRVVPAVSGTGTGTDTSTGTSTDTSTTTGNTRYYYTPVSNIITMTAIEPVRTGDIISPLYDPSLGPTDLLISDLQDPTIDMFAWNAKAGADIYYMKVEPVIPGNAPSWQSSNVYATGPTIKLPQSERTKLATILSGYPDKVMRWRVYCRHQADTSQAWVEGEDNLFKIIGTPPGRP